MADNSLTITDNPNLGVSADDILAEVGDDFTELSDGGAISDAQLLSIGLLDDERNRSAQ